MSNAVTIMKIFGFIALVSGLIVILAADENFKGLDAYRTQWDHFQEQLAQGNPLGDRQPNLGGIDTSGCPPNSKCVDFGDDFQAASTRWCLIQEYCPDIPLWSDLVDNTISFGASVLALARTAATVAVELFGLINWLGDMAWTVLTILVLAVTFTIPGIPLQAQLLLWVINLSMWGAMIYIAFQTITGAISGAVPF